MARIREANPRTARAWSIFMLVIDAVSSIPVERMAFSRRRSAQGEGPSPPTTSAKSPRPSARAHTIEQAGAPSTEETVAWQRRQMAKELYSLQKNLAAGGLIDGKPCDCIADKHCLGLEALTEETMAMHDDPVYQELLDWNKDVAVKGTPEAIVSGEHKEDYRRMAKEARGLRKRLLGTLDPAAMVTGEERGEILSRAKDIARGKADELVEKELEVASGSDRRGD